jgi:hypothetical protein
VDVYGDRSSYHAYITIDGLGGTYGSSSGTAYDSDGDYSFHNIKAELGV